MRIYLLSFHAMQGSYIVMREMSLLFRSIEHVLREDLVWNVAEYLTSMFHKNLKNWIFLSKQRIVYSVP